MLELYPQIKQAHVWLVMASGTLFLLRALAALAGQRWPQHLAVRSLSYTIDTFLLTAALMLLVALKLNPFVVPWLSVKLALLVTYIVLGSLALKRGRTRATRATCYFAALAVYLFIVSVAVAHDPWGVFAWLHS